MEGIGSRESVSRLQNWKASEPEWQALPRNVAVLHSRAHTDPDALGSVWVLTFHHQTTLVDVGLIEIEVNLLIADYLGHVAVGSRIQVAVRVSFEDLR